MPTESATKNENISDSETKQNTSSVVTGAITGRLLPKGRKYLQRKLNNYHEETKTIGEQHQMLPTFPLKVVNEIMNNIDLITIKADIFKKTSMTSSCHVQQLWDIICYARDKHPETSTGTEDKVKDIAVSNSVKVQHNSDTENYHLLS